MKRLDGGGESGRHGDRHPGDGFKGGEGGIERAGRNVEPEDRFRIGAPGRWRRGGCGPSENGKKGQAEGDLERTEPNHARLPCDVRGSAETIHELKVRPNLTSARRLTPTELVGQVLYPANCSVPATNESAVLANCGAAAPNIGP